MLAAAGRMQLLGGSRSGDLLGDCRICPGWLLSLAGEEFESSVRAGETQDLEWGLGVAVVSVRILGC